MPGERGTPARRRTNPVFLQRLVIIALVWGTAAYFLSDLGHHSDDWGFLYPLLLHHDQSVGGLYRHLAETPNLAVRPLQILWYIAFHKWAPGDTTLVHLSNHLVFMLAALVLHATLRCIEGVRAGAYPITLIFVCLPNFMTAKLWYANHQSTISLLLGFLAFYQMTRMRTAASARETWLRGGAAAALTAGSMLAYELLTFVMLTWPLFAWFFDAGGRKSLLADRPLRYALLAVAAGVGAAVLFKLPYFEATGNDLSRPFSPLSVAALYAQAAAMNFWTLGLYLPRAAVGLLMGDYFRPVALAAALLAAALVWLGKLFGAGPRPAGNGNGAEPAAELVLLAGGVLFAAGFAGYLSNFHVGWSAFGISNRGYAGGAVGVAVMAYALYRMVARWRSAIAWPLLLFFCATGIFIQVTLGRLWSEAWMRQQRIYADVSRAVGPLRAGQSVLIYGYCPYHGPAPVFTAWGIGHRLKIDRRNEHIHGAILTSETELSATGITIREYGDPNFFPYRGMVIFNGRDGSVTRIATRADARDFFAGHPIAATTGCAYQEGGGLRLY